MAEKNGGTFVRDPFGERDKKKPGRAKTPGTSSTDKASQENAGSTADELKVPPAWSGGDGGAGWAY